MHGSPLKGVAVALALLASTPALAQSAPVAVAAPVGPDVVYLKGGGFVRGTLVDVIPGQGAHIQVATGEITTVPWKSIDRVVPTAVPSPEISGGEAPPQAHAGPARAPAKVRLHVDGPADVEIAGRPTEGNAGWTTVCTGACDQPVPLDWQYEVRGDGIKTSSMFFLNGVDGGSAALKVDPASKGTFVLGVVGIGAGALGTVVGGYLVLFGVIWGRTSSVGSNGAAVSNQSTGDALVTGGAVTGGVGLAVVVGGLLMTVANISTGVKQTGSRDARAAPTFLPRFESALAVPPVPGALGAPLVTVRF